MADAASAVVDAGGFEITEGRTLPSGTASTLVDGRPVTFPGYTILAVAELDLDADGDRDALLALGSATDVATGVARRTPDGFGLTLAGRAIRPEGCETAAANVRVHSPEIAILTHRMRCAAGPRIGYEVATLGGNPRAVFSVDVEPPAADDPFLTSVTVVPKVADANSDGTNDVVFEVETQDRFGGARRKESFAVLQGITGYATTLATVTTRATAIARSATRDLRRQAARAARDAAHGLAFVRALCPESGTPPVRLRGLDSHCGEHGAPAAFGGTLAIALAKTAKADELLRLLGVLDGRGVALDASTTSALAEAMRGVRGRISPTYQRLPLPAEVPPDAPFGFDANSVLTALGPSPGRFGAAPIFAFSQDPTAALAPPLAVRRYGDQLLLARGGHARIVALPSLEGGAIRECVVAPDARAIVCRTDSGPIVATIGGPA